MDAERIVRALAGLDEPVDSEYCLCVLCHADLPSEANPRAAPPPPGAPLGHEDCPWRLAREWVAANPG